ncbi:hypothetical protein CURTO8I2_280088 [Curtobacterium sp. 8I-2]|nr:hypothetical protein CURTO8I2_280088 [Curtobacterium sp. 8I-2]
MDHWRGPGDGRGGGFGARRPGHPRVRRRGHIGHDSHDALRRARADRQRAAHRLRLRRAHRGHGIVRTRRVAAEPPRERRSLHRWADRRGRTPRRLVRACAAHLRRDARRLRRVARVRIRAAGLPGGRAQGPGHRRGGHSCPVVGTDGAHRLLTPGRPSRTRAGRIDDHGRTGLHRAALRPSRDLRQHPLGGRRRPPAA